jgi:catechol 2,3-dioxygenase-like lactoylglutathione lyase family enzyme
MAIAFDGGLTCALSVTNLDRSIAWYRDTLGFSLLYRRDDIAWCEMATPVARVNVGLGQVEQPHAKGGVTPTFGVTDMSAAKASLDAASVPQDGPVREIAGMVRLLTFFDPDGNALMFYQDLQGASH